MSQLQKETTMLIEFDYVYTSKELLDGRRDGWKRKKKKEQNLVW